MRGKEVYANYALLECGITPAHAGKSVALLTGTVTAKDHPRTCGEKAAVQLPHST